MKMYILIRDDVPLGFAVLASAHASLAAYMKFSEREEIKAWLSGPFYKVVCRVNAKEFEKARSVKDNVILTESALQNREVALLFVPELSGQNLLSSTNFLSSRYTVYCGGN